MGSSYTPTARKQEQMMILKKPSSLHSGDLSRIFVQCVIVMYEKSRAVDVDPRAYPAHYTLSNYLYHSNYDAMGIILYLKDSHLCQV